MKNSEETFHVFEGDVNNPHSKCEHCGLEFGNEDIRKEHFNNAGVICDTEI